jgi:hypothetical protein
MQNKIIEGGSKGLTHMQMHATTYSMPTILETLERGLAVQARKLRTTTLVRVRIQLFLGQDVAARLIGSKQ